LCNRESPPPQPALWLGSSCYLRISILIAMLSAPWNVCNFLRLFRFLPEYKVFAMRACLGFPCSWASKMFFDLLLWDFSGYQGGSWDSYSWFWKIR
jgi:hypothetical protein